MISWMLLKYHWMMSTKSNPFNHVGFLCPSGTILPKLSLVTFPKLRTRGMPKLKFTYFAQALISLLCWKDHNSCEEADNILPHLITILC